MTEQPAELCKDKIVHMEEEEVKVCRFWTQEAGHQSTRRMEPDVKNRFYLKT